jgi:hypothetical protein
MFVLWAPVAVCSDPWVHKKPDQWTAQDVQQVLTDSPWVQSGSVRFPEQAIIHDESPGSAQADPMAAGSGGRGGMQLPGNQLGRWDGGVGRDTSGAPTLPVIIRWDSALPVRAALVRSGQSDETLARSATDYIVTVIGLWPGERQTHQQQEADDNSLGAAPPEVRAVQPALPAAPEKLRQMRSGLMASTKLLVKGRSHPIEPDDVTLDEKTGAIHFFFPRADPITLNDKEVTLVAQFGSMRVFEKFHLKDMTEKGKLEL